MQDQSTVLIEYYFTSLLFESLLIKKKYCKKRMNGRRETVARYKNCFSLSALFALKQADLHHKVKSLKADVLLMLH